MAHTARFRYLVGTLRRRGIGLLAVAALAAGCGAADGDAPGEPRTRLTSAESDLLYVAEQRLIRDCMAADGFEYVVVPPIRPDRKDAGRPFGIADVARARTDGYSEEAPSVPTARPNGRYVAGLSADRRRRYQRALDGTDPAAIVVEVPGVGTVFTSSDGCQSKARHHLYGDLRVWTRAKAIITNLPAITFPELRRDPAYAAALLTWRSCMSLRGFGYASPAEAVTAVRARSGPGVSPEERRTAVADAQCNSSSRLAVVGAERHRVLIDLAARGRFRAEAVAYDRAVTRALTRAGRTSSR